MSEPSPSYVSDPENVLQSSYRSDCDQTNDIPDLVCETGVDSIGAPITPEVLHPPVFTPITVDPDDFALLMEYGVDPVLSVVGSESIIPRDSRPR